MSSAHEHELIEKARRIAAAVRARTGSDAAPPRLAAREIPAALLPHDIFPGYSLVREIHRGGQGVVYLARQIGTQRDVAIKVMRGGPLGDRREQVRFEREVQILAGLRHPDIVTIHESGVAGGFSFFVMDYFAGRPLDRWLADSAILPADGPDPIRDLNLSAGGRPANDPRTTLRLFGRICDAVNAAHLRGVIHRDLKPGNVLIDEGGEPHILDFGLARRTTDGALDGSDAVTDTGQFVGSPPWASPEQAAGRVDGLDVRTDVYSLGVMLYHALTGRFPYAVRGPVREILENVANAAPDSLRTHAPTLDRDIETIVLKCLAKEPERRYQSAGELARDIRHYLAGEPIDARRDSPLYLLRKTLRRYRWPLAGAAAFAMLLGAFAVVMGVLYAGQSEQRRRADEEARRARAAQASAEHFAAQTGLMFHEARSAVEFLTDQVSTELEPLFGTAQVRREILQRAFERLSRLARSQSSEPALQIELAHLHAKLAKVAVELEDRAGIAEHREHARGILQQILHADPQHIEAQLLLGQLSMTEADEALARGAVEEARVRYQTILAAYERVATADPDSPETLRRLSLAYERMALLARAQNDRTADGEWTEQMYATKCRMVELDPENPLYQYELSVAEERLAENARRAGDLEAFEDHALAALALRQNLVDHHPPDRRHLRALSISFEQLSVLANLRKDQAGELEWLRRMHDVKRQLVGREPSNWLFQHDLAICLDRLGAIERRQNNPAEALKLHAQAGDIYRHLIDAGDSRPRFHIDLIASLQQAGAAALSAGDHAAFQQKLLESIRLAEDFQRVFPHLRDSQPYRAAAHQALGIHLLDSGSEAEGRSHLQTALDVCEEILALDPANRAATRRAEEIRRKLGEAAQ